MVASAATTHAVRDRAWTRPLVSATPFATGLAFHTLLRPRDHLEPRDRDAITAGDAQSVQSRRDALQGAADVADGLARRGRQGQIPFAFDAHRVTFARLLVELGVALLALRRELLGRGLELLGLVRPDDGLGRRLLRGRLLRERFLRDGRLLLHRRGLLRALRGRGLRLRRLARGDLGHFGHADLLVGVRLGAWWARLARSRGPRTGRTGHGPGRRRIVAARLVRFGHPARSTSERSRLSTPRRSGRWARCCWPTSSRPRRSRRACSRAKPDTAAPTCSRGSRRPTR